MKESEEVKSIIKKIETGVQLSASESCIIVEELKELKSLLEDPMLEFNCEALNKNDQIRFMHLLKGA